MYNRTVVKPTTRAALFEQGMRIRALERLLLKLYQDNQIFGTVHTCIGQELCAAALHAHLDVTREQILRAAEVIRATAAASVFTAVA